ncbi:hypothetical protein D3C80_2106320 [compost metagenome]
MEANCSRSAWTKAADTFGNLRSPRSDKATDTKNFTFANGKAYVIKAHAIADAVDFENNFACRLV